MKELFIITSLFFTSIIFSQENIRKQTEPITILDSITLKQGQNIELQEGKNSDGSFRFVFFINNFNDILGNADSRASYKSEEIKFFKKWRGDWYIITKYFGVKADAAIRSGEVVIK